MVESLVEGVAMTTANDLGTMPGKLAEAAGKCFPLQVLKSRAGYYIGTRDDDGSPYSRESVEYWEKLSDAEAALVDGRWTQKREP
jgi:hypothetical protein